MAPADAPPPGRRGAPAAARSRGPVPTASTSPSSTAGDSSPTAGVDTAPPKFQVISLNDTTPKTRDYKRRKAHKKSKAGCSACKKKRVKCDQATPVCLRCQRNDRLCLYEQDDFAPGPGGGPAPPPARAASRAASRAAVIRRGGPGIRYPQTVAAFPGSEPDVGTSSALLLHHFHTNWATIFDMPTFTGSLMPMALRYPHVRNTIMAVAAANLRHRAPASKEHRLAEHFQQGLAVQGYRRALSTPLAVHGQAGTDSLLMTAVLMNMLAFALPMEEDAEVGEPDPARSWVFSPRDDRLAWLAVQMGLSPLLAATRPWRPRSFLAPLFRNSDDERRTLSGSWPRLAKVPVAWLAVFGLDREAPRPGHDGPAAAAPVSAGDRLFRDPLRVLAELCGLEPARRNLLRYFQFLGHLHDEFRLLLYYRDEKALWTFGMWLGLLCRFPGVWWTEKRAKRDFKAIRMWLHQVGVERRPGSEGMLWRELIRDLDATWGYHFETGNTPTKGQ